MVETVDKNNSLVAKTLFAEYISKEGFSIEPYRLSLKRNATRDEVGWCRMNLCYAKLFRSDYKVPCRRKWYIGRLNNLIDHLALNHNSHTLKGKFIGKRECRVSFDWIVIYGTSRDVIKLLRTGTHFEILYD